MANGGDGYDKAIEELTQKAKRQSKAAAKLTRIKRDQLILEQKAAKRALKSLNQAQKQLIDRLKYDLQANDPNLLRNLASDRTLMNDYLLKNGFGDATAELLDAQQDILNSVLDGVKVIDPTADLNTLGPAPFNQLQIETTQAVFDDVILSDTIKALRPALINMSVLEDPSSVLSGLAQQMKKSTGRQLTEVKTKISEFGRSANALMAKDFGLDYYLYTGPIDGLTRGFCFHLVNKVVSSDQMAKLNNNQIGTALTYGGGYNCRHSWTPVSKGYIEAAGLKLATDKDIKDANDAAKEIGRAHV